MDGEKKKIKLLTNKADTIDEELIIFKESPDDQDMVLLEMTVEGQKISCSSDNFFAALIDLRSELEKRGIQILCNGAAKNVYPSPMQLSMGYVKKAYKIYLGQQARNSETVDIFEYEEDLMFTSIEKQSKFHDEWIKSIMG
ncbi:hypothetical protein [Clostridium sp. 'White wine YQ']|uniref:hypothetical protein n=1 Tax=Clostridium sp. 'White wine YQ' TaxID=3027474 RepID=UPI0023651A83|nr:hypothetical protein [Clostridium sp. 'White wine YQ']MDD7793076.1 hypothetical protein [Clostridium sp. 'White wine YQ']